MFSNFSKNTNDEYRYCSYDFRPPNAVLQALERPEHLLNPCADPLCRFFCLSCLSPRPAKASYPPGKQYMEKSPHDLGPCSAAITVTGADSKPVYAAKITARVQYGVMGIQKLDLEDMHRPGWQIERLRDYLSRSRSLWSFTSPKDDKGRPG